MTKNLKTNKPLDTRKSLTKIRQRKWLGSIPYLADDNNLFSQETIKFERINFENKIITEASTANGSEKLIYFMEWKTKVFRYYPINDYIFKEMEKILEKEEKNLEFIQITLEVYFMDSHYQRLVDLARWRKKDNRGLFDIKKAWKLFKKEAYGEEYYLEVEKIFLLVKVITQGLPIIIEDIYAPIEQKLTHIKPYENLPLAP